jgi:hypothetical protein
MDLCMKSIWGNISGEKTEVGVSWNAPIFVDVKIVGEISTDNRTQNELFTDKGMQTNVLDTIHRHPCSVFQPL